jgi:Domain of unknown function (DUF4349)
MGGRRWVLSSLIFVVVAGLVGAACSAGGGRPASAPVEGPQGAPMAPLASPAPGNAADVVGASLPQLRQRVVKTASISLQLKKGVFTQQFQEASLIAGRHGGYVASSETTEAKLRSGTVVLRVPADQFETALAELKGLGKVQSERIAGQDVTGQFVDLQARLRNWESQETVLLRLMNKASTIDDSIKVQRQLQDVQLAIEEIRGQVHALSDQADLSTITIAMAEAGAVLPNASRSLLARAWHQAVHGFVAVIAAVVVAVGYVLPVGLLLFAAGTGWFLIRRRRRGVVAAG